MSLSTFAHHSAPSVVEITRFSKDTCSGSVSRELRWSMLSTVRSVFPAANFRFCRLRRVKRSPHQPAAAHFPVLPARTPHNPTSSLTIPRYHSWPPRFCQGLHRETSHPGVVCWATCPTRALLVVGLLTLTPCSIPRLGFPNRYDIGLFRWSDIAARSFFALTFSCRAALSPNPYVPRLSLDRVV
jgi:hypothetical protein